MTVDHTPDEQHSTWVHLDMSVITVHGLQAIRDEQEARDLASAMDLELQACELNKDATISAALNDQIMQVKSTSPNDGLRGTTQFWVQVYDHNGSLQHELDHIATTLHKALTHINHRPDENPASRLTLTIRHCMNSDHLPPGQPERRVDEPISQFFQTETGQPFLSTMTWERETDFNKEIQAQPGQEDPTYSFWSQSVTRIQAIPTTEHMLQLLMATYTLGALFLLEMPLPRPGTPSD